ASSSGERGRLPVWVVRMRAVLMAVRFAAARAPRNYAHAIPASRRLRAGALLVERVRRGRGDERASLLDGAVEKGMLVSPTKPNPELQGLLPWFHQWVNDTLFGEVWERPQLSKRDRSLIT